MRGYVERTDARYRTAWDAQPPKGAARQEAIDNAELDLAVASDRAPRHDHDGYVSEMMDAIAKDADVTVDEGPDAAAFYQLVKRALVEVCRRAVARAQGDHRVVFFDHLFDPAGARLVPMGDVIDQFVALQTEEAAARRLSEKHVDKMRAQADTVDDLLGRDTPVQAVDHDRCLIARGVLARLPRNRTKIYGKLRLEEVVQRAEAAKEPRLSFISQQQYLGCMKQVLDLAVSKGLLRTNPATSLAPLALDDVAAEDKRAPFTADQLTTLFHSRFYEHCAVSGPQPYRLGGAHRATMP